jgi:hypothetical protein
MALLTALMAMLMMVALGAGLTLTTMTESSIAANHRDGLQTLYAAEAGIELAISRLRTTPDWGAVFTAGAATTLLVEHLADVVQNTAVDSRFTITVTVSPDPNGDRDLLVLQSTAVGPGGNRRNIQVTVRRLPADASGARAVDTVAWR